MAAVPAAPAAITGTEEFQFMSLDTGNLVNLHTMSEARAHDIP